MKLRVMAGFGGSSAAGGRGGAFRIRTGRLGDEAFRAVGARARPLGRGLALFEGVWIGWELRNRRHRGLGGGARPLGRGPSSLKEAFDGLEA